MPASHSPSRRAKQAPAAPARRARWIWPWILIGLAAVLAVVVIALPASMVSRAFPPALRAEDFSGSLWHGSAGKITVNGRDGGALEWRLQPGALLHMTVAAELHWVKVGFVIDGTASLDRHGYAAHDIKGGGPIQDLHDVGVAAGWQGTADVKFSEIAGDYSKLSTAVGEITVSNLTAAQIAEGADLGSYDLRLADGAVSADGSVTMQLSDLGGPLEAEAQLRLMPAERSGLLTGTFRERPDAPQALRSQLDSLSQVRGRDPQGRITAELEFTY